jgi:hypothetical protein
MTPHSALLFGFYLRDVSEIWMVCFACLNFSTDFIWWMSSMLAAVLLEMTDHAAGDFARFGD